MKDKTCCFTGHRSIPEYKQKNLSQMLEQTIKEKIATGYRIFCTGGALGFDTLAAQTVIKLRKKYTDIQLHLYLPYPNQRENWSAADKKVYDNIIKESDFCTYLCREYTPYCMSLRNRRLVDNSSACIAYCTQTKGGTVYTLGYAIDCGLNTVNIAQWI